MLSSPNPPRTAPPPPPLSSRKELFSHHVARGASLAQAARLAGYSPQGARQRGSVLMAESDVRLRVETLRHAWMAERQGRVERAIERLDEIIDMAMELQRPTAALKAMDFQLKLSRRHPRHARRPLRRQSRRRPVQSLFRPEGGRGPRFQPGTPTRPPPKQRFLFPNPTNQPNREDEPHRPRRKSPIDYICGLIPPVIIPTAA